MKKTTSYENISLRYENSYYSTKIAFVRRREPKSYERYGNNLLVQNNVPTTITDSLQTA